MTCKTCKHLGVTPDSIGRIVVRGDGFCYPCTVRIPEPVVPASVSTDRDWRWPPGRSWMQGSDGAGCPLHEPRVKSSPSPKEA